jgi:hypothetical protein
VLALVAAWPEEVAPHAVRPPASTSIATVRVAASAGDLIDVAGSIT